MYFGIEKEIEPYGSRVTQCGVHFGNQSQDKIAEAVREMVC